jgi:enediyne biosynthesis protein E4
MRTDRPHPQPPACPGGRVPFLRAGLVFLLAAELVGCRPAEATVPAEPDAAGPVWFQDVTDDVGLSFTHDAGPTDGKYFLPQIMGSGAALFDFDGDGRLDVYLLQNGGPGSPATNRLFRQGADGRFTDVSAGSGLDVAGHCMGVAVGDVNNDGRPDVLLTFYRGVRLFLNNGDGTFTDVTREAGLDSPFWGTSAAFFDYDRDGWLDLVVVNYVDYDPSVHCTDAGGRPSYCHPSTFYGTVATLYHNRGPAPDARGPSVRFEDVTLGSGLGRLPGPGLGVTCADFDGDGWPDVLVANDDKPNRLWINQHDGTFKEEAHVRGLALSATARAEGNMGIALGDVDGDGRFDVFITHLSEETHTLWVQRPGGTFQDRTTAAGLAGPRWRGTGFGTVLADFDHDGALDLAVVNGRVSRGRPADNPALAPYWREYAERNQLFANDGAGRFTDVSPHNAPFCGSARVSRGLAVGDVDGDGALDLLVTTVAGPARLYRNVAPKRGHWLLVRAVDPALRRDAYGATITVQAGGHRRVASVNPAQSYLCSNDPRVHFGLGPADWVESIGVAWPDGSAEVFAGRAADQGVTLRKGEGRPAVRGEAP